MNAERRALARVLILATLPWAMFAACAEGNDIDQPAGAGASSGTGTGGGTGEIGSLCVNPEDCVEGTCTQVGAEKYCTIECPPDCPQGTYCAIIEGDPICVPDLGQLCGVCDAPIDCASPSDACLKAPLGDKFCAIDCSTMGICPNGFTCVEASVYANGGTGGSGGADAGTDAGTDGGTDGGTSTGTGMPPTGVPYKYCVPNNGSSCPCTNARDGVTHACTKENAFGECSGTETCNGEIGGFEGCTATTPAAETCNGKDDDCNAQVDDGDPGAMCGQPPPNAQWACTTGQCAFGACDPGWAQYPPGPVSQGCTCPQESGEPNNDCATPTNAGSVSDAGGMLTLAGTLSSDTDVDFWLFDTLDTAEVNNNSYHVSIDFTGPTPNDEFQLDVIRGNACVALPTGPAAGITSYDWCVDGLAASGVEGEAGCGPQAPVHCNNNASPYYVRVSRKPGATGTCTQYQITVTAAGGDPCDFTVKCP